MISLKRRSGCYYTMLSLFWFLYCCTVFPPSDSLFAIWSTYSFFSFKNLTANYENLFFPHYSPPPLSQLPYPLHLFKEKFLYKYSRFLHCNLLVLRQGLAIYIRDWPATHFHQDEFSITQWSPPFASQIHWFWVSRSIHHYVCLIFLNFIKLHLWIYL